MRKDNFGLTPILLYFNDTLMPDFQVSLYEKDIEIYNKNGVSYLEEPISLIITVDMTRLHPSKQIRMYCSFYIS